VPRKCRDIEVFITASITKVAQPNSRMHCLLAIALREQHGFASIHINRGKVRFNDLVRKTRFVYDLPEEIVRRLERFDAGLKVRPFRATLRGATAFSSPIARRPFATRRGPTVCRHLPDGERCPRRYHKKK